MSNTLFGCENFSAGAYEGRSTPNVNLGPHHISETIRAGKLKFYTQLGYRQGQILVLGCENFSQRGIPGAQRPIM